eukprot:548710-Amphidinium_carterae.1
MPTASSLQSWLILTRQEIIAASDRSPHEAEDPDSSAQDLSVVGRFASLESKLASALLRIAKGHVQVSLQLQCQQAHRTGTPTTGRQLLQTFVREFDLDHNHAALYGIHDLIAVNWLGDAHLRNFLENWTTTLNRIGRIPDQDVLQSLLWGHLRKSQVMRHDILLYDRLKDGDRAKTYDALMEILRRQVRRDMFDKNREQVVRSGDQILSVPAGTQGSEGTRPNSRDRSD